jgi:hypothetical protein
MPGCGEAREQPVEGGGVLARKPRDCRMAAPSCRWRARLELQPCAIWIDQSET